MYFNRYNPYSLELYHHGIQGQKWGVRRYQYEDGSLTPEGKKRYYVNGEDSSSGYTKEGEKWQREDKAERKRYRKYKKAYNKYYEDMKKYGFKDSEHNIRYEYLKERDEQIKRRNKAIAKIAVTATVAALAYKFGPTLWKNYGAPWMNTQMNNVKTAALNKGKQIVRDAVNEAVENANKTATKAAQAAVDTAKSTVTNAATNASKAVSKTATNASKAVRTGASKAGKVAQDIWIPKSWRR